MRKIALGFASLMLVCAAGSLSAQTANPTFKSDDTTKADTHDRPVGGVKMKLPLPAGNPPPTNPPPPPPAPNPVPPPTGQDVPPTETPPDPPPPEDPPTYYDEPVAGKFAFDLDASGSMYGSRIASVRQETTNVINQLTEDDEFDCASYGGQFSTLPGYTKFMWGQLLPGSDGNKSAAINWVNGPSTNPGGMTPSYASLQKCIEVWPADMNKFFFLTDGSPNITGSASQILADFPGWWTKMQDCTLVCICIGGVGAAQQFMMQLAATAGGSYIQR